MGVDLDAPDHTTLSRRGADLKVFLASRVGKRPIDLIIESRGLAIVGEGEWAAAKHGGNGRRGWKKLYPGLDARGEVVGQILTDSNVGDGSTGVAIIEDVPCSVRTVIADAANDTRPIYDAAEAQGAEVVVPPTSNASTSTRRRRTKAHNRTVRRSGDGGEGWSGRHRQGRVDHKLLRFKAVIVGRHRARSWSAKEAEAAVAYNTLHRMRELGWPKSVKVTG